MPDQPLTWSDVAAEFADIGSDEPLNMDDSSVKLIRAEVALNAAHRGMAELRRQLAQEKQAHYDTIAVGEEMIREINHLTHQLADAQTTFNLERGLREKAESELHDLNLTFDLRWKADMRAIEYWRKAHPGNDLVMPDHADLCTWLLEQLELKQAQKLDTSNQPRRRPGLVTMSDLDPDACPPAADLRAKIRTLGREAAEKHREALDMLKECEGQNRLPEPPKNPRLEQKGP